MISATYGVSKPERSASLKSTGLTVGPAVAGLPWLCSLMFWLGAPPTAFAQSPPADRDLPQGALLRLGTTRLRETSDVRDLAFSKDGRSIIATAGTFVRTWDAATGDEQRSFPIAWSHRVTLSGDGALLAYSPFRNFAEVIDTATGSILGRFEGDEKRGVEQMAFSPDNRLLAVSFRHEVRVWNVHEKKLMHRWQWPEIPFVSGSQPCFSPDGGRLACAVDGAGIYLWDVASGRQLHFLRPERTEGSHFCYVVFSPDGKTLATYNRSGAFIDLWDAEVGKHLRQLGPEHSFHGAYGFLPDDKTLVAADRPSSITLWDLATGKRRRNLAQEGAPVGCLALSPDGKRLAAGGNDHAIRLFCLETMKEITPGRHPLSGPASLRLLADGRTLMTWDTWNHSHRSPTTPLFRFWDLHGKPLKTTPQTADSLWGFEPSPTGKRAAVIKHEAMSRLYLRELDGNQDKEIWNVTGWNIHRVAFALQGDLLLVQVQEPPGAEPGLFERPIKVLRRRGQVWQEVAFVPSWDFVVSADGAQLLSYAIANREGRLLLWNADTGQRQVQFFSKGFSTPLAVSSCARRLVIDATQHEPLLIDSASGAVAARLPKHEAEPRFAFSPRGDLLACGARDGTILLYDGLTGEELTKLRGHRAGFASLRFSPDGMLLLSGNYDTTAMLWDMAPWQPRTRLKPTAFSPKDLDKLWDDLGAEGSASWRAVAELTRAPDQAIGLLRRRLRPAHQEAFAPADAWIARLDDAAFEIRQKASTALEALGDKAVPPLRRALTAKPSLETKRRIELLLPKLELLPPSPDALRGQRALAVLELLGDLAAGELLEDLTRGIREADLTREAQAALRRLRAPRRAELPGAF